MSTPQPKVSFGWKVLEWLARMTLSVVILTVTVVLVFWLVIEILRTPSGQTGVILLVGLIALLGWLWGKLPEWLRKFLRKYFMKRRGRHEDQ
jgi:Co/Zn/Cd efflux system component